MPGKERYVAWGLAAGWLIALLAARNLGLTFLPSQPVEGILNYCIRIGYPKNQDWFWYGAAVGIGWAGALAGVLLRLLVARTGWKGAFPGWPVPAGLGCGVAAFLLGLSRNHGESLAAIILALLFVILPWLDRGWLREAPRSPSPAIGAAFPLHPGWIITLLAVSVLWLADPCLMRRGLDHHEGLALLYVQNWLASDLPGLDFHTIYGPLCTVSLGWWMKLFGVTVSAERWYFLAAQMAGTAVHLLLVRAFCRGTTAVVLGIWLMLTLSTASVIQYGWSNPLRTALPLAALALCWRGTVSNRPVFLAFSGVLTTLSLIYAPEYALAGICASAILLASNLDSPGLRQAASRAMQWVLPALVAAVIFLTLMYGAQITRVPGGHMSGGYLTARLLGHAARPLPAFPWLWTTTKAIADIPAMLWAASVWVPGLAACAGVAWATAHGGTNRGILLAMAVFSLISQVPVVARPLTQIASSMPPMVLLAVMALDLMWHSRAALRFAAWILAAVLIAYSFATPIGGALPALDRYACLGHIPAGAHAPGVTRLGRIAFQPDQADIIREIVPLLRTKCPPKGRVYVGTAYLAYVCFLADRPALPPFPMANLAATTADKEAVLTALKDLRPPVALIGIEGIDVPYTEEHAREWKYIEGNYRFIKQVGKLQVFARKDSK